MARGRDQHGIDAERVRRAECAADVGIVAHVLEHGNATGAGEHLRGIGQRRALEGRHGTAHDLVAGDLREQRVGHAQHRAAGVLREQLASKRRGVVGPGLAYQEGARTGAGLNSCRDDRARLRHEQASWRVGPSGQIGIAHTRIRRQTCIVCAGQMLIRHRAVLSSPGCLRQGHRAGPRLARVVASRYFIAQKAPAAKSVDTSALKREVGK